MQFKLNTLATSAMLAMTLRPSTVSAGPIAYGICQTGCNVVAVACYAAAGFTFGTIAAPLAPPAILGCNAALGTCSATCATVALLAPTP
ncbi:hypothetical protein CVT24_004163 [Panaeolus cyanescens]|uniref:Cysteine-rich protein n=1 Tax=Panaeolus cyanescens TaxID=181874 RepID=A0A409W7W8_9AGAR|nr:hypothetical protein CVT24_004163 [Panaeolus cyanescens]